MVLKTSAAPAARIASLALLGALGVQAAPLVDRLDGAYERILAKHGIEITGEINSEYLKSSIDGGAVADNLYDYETVQYTAFDLGMQYRPYDFIWTRADFRFYQDWQTFFSTRSRILTARWLSVDGNISQMLGFNVGDFRTRWTPLTLGTPGLDLLHEPLIFSRRRAELMEEKYLEGGERNLQGVNLNFAKRFDSPLSEVRLDGIASRLRRAEFLDANGAQGSGMDRSDMDRFFFAGNGEAMLMDNLLLGGSLLRTADDRDSYEQMYLSQKLRQEIIDTDPSLLPPDGRSLNGRDSVVARDLTVVGAHGGLDLAGFLGMTRLTLELMGDWAQSSESNKFAWAWKRDSLGKLQSSEKAAPGTDGSALNLELGAGWQAPDSAFGFRLVGRYLKNEAAFLNPVAQSPSFIARRIMNTENDFGGRLLYSPFDAMNNGVYKFTPSSGSTAPYQHAPFEKSSYSNGVLSPEDLAFFNPDPTVQLALPFGMATPNRAGATARLLGHWNNAVHATVDLAFLEEAEGRPRFGTAAEPAKISQMGGGLKLDLDGLLGWELPFELTGSFVRGQMERAAAASEKAPFNITSDLAMAGLYYRFFTKWAFLAGWQQARLEGPLFGSPANAATQIHQWALKESHSNIQAGIEYTLTRTAYLMVSGGLSDTDHEETHQGGITPSTPADPARNAKRDFSRVQTQALINVKF